MIALPKTGDLVVASRTIAPGTVLAEGDVKTIEWSGNALPTGFVSSPADVVGRGVMGGLQENEPVLEGKLAPRGAGGGLPVMIENGKRALTMRVNDVSGVAGFVTPNTHVDVLLTIDNKSNPGGEPASRIIMQDVRTLAAGQQIQPDKDGKPVSVGVVTFLVSPEQAETLALASQQGSIQLALRNMLDTAEVRTFGTRTSALLGGAVRPVAPRRAVVVRPTTPDPAPQPSQTVIEVYRGGTRTLQKF